MVSACCIAAGEAIRPAGLASSGDVGERDRRIDGLPDNSRIGLVGKLLGFPSRQPDQQPAFYFRRKAGNQITDKPAITRIL